MTIAKILAFILMFASSQAMAQAIGGNSNIDVTGIASLNQLTGRGATPAVAAGTGAGTGPSVALGAGSTDLGGTIILTTGTSTIASAILATITFATTKSIAPHSCQINAQTVNAIGQVSMVYSGIPTITSFTLNVAGAAIPASTTYQWGYQCNG